TTTRPTTTSTRTPRPNLLTASIRSSRDRLPSDPQRSGPNGGEQPDRDRAGQLRVVPERGGRTIHRERGRPAERPVRTADPSLERPRTIELSRERRQVAAAGRTGPAA